MNTCVFLQINKEPFGHLKFHFFWTFFYCSSFSFVRRAFTQFARATPNFSLLNSLTLLLNRLLCFTGKKKTARILRLTQYHFHAKFRKQRDHTAPYRPDIYPPRATPCTLSSGIVHITGIIRTPGGCKHHRKWPCHWSIRFQQMASSRGNTYFNHRPGVGRFSSWNCFVTSLDVYNIFTSS